MQDSKETFTYTYSAREREEIKQIREKYAPPTEKEISMERLRRLDASATRGATIAALIVGILSALLLGVGMCCTMLAGWERYFVPGIAVGVTGLLGMAAACPLYVRLVRRRRAKLAPEILRLADELMK
ncbi:MAG: hypothetical protein ACI4OI_06950 [Gemmiger sp.]